MGWVDLGTEELGLGIEEMSWVKITGLAQQHSLYLLYNTGVMTKALMT